MRGTSLLLVVTFRLAVKAVEHAGDCLQQHTTLADSDKDAHEQCVLSNEKQGM